MMVFREERLPSLAVTGVQSTSDHQFVEHSYLKLIASICRSNDEPPCLQAIQSQSASTTEEIPPQAVRPERLNLFAKK